MSERSPSVNEGTREISNAVSLFVGGKIYEGWEDCKITRELNSAASDFQLQLVDKWRVDQEPWRIKPGEHVHIHLGKQSVLTGYVDRVEASISSSSKSLTVAGRSKTADLVDCSVEGPSSYSGLSIAEIAVKICNPFGIKVRMLGAAGAAFATVAVQQGETAFALLDRLCRERKLLMLCDYEGNLVLTGRGSARAATELRQGVNVLSGHSVLDNSNRFSKYIVKGQDLGGLGDIGKSIGAMGSATDEGITRYRPHIMLAENAVNDASGENRASYEAHLRAAKALGADIQVQGWTQGNGKLWEVNQLVYVDVGFLGLKRRMLIQKVDFNKGSNGTTSMLSLIREDAYGFEKKVKKAADMGWAKGLGEAPAFYPTPTGAPIK